MKYSVITTFLSYILFSLLLSLNWEEVPRIIGKDFYGGVVFKVLTFLLSS